jgi:small ligand-binding sensory domain FIST
MIECGAGCSSAGSGERAIEEAITAAMTEASLRAADLVLVFATSHYACEFTRMLKSVRAATGASHIVGCSGMGVLTSGREIERKRGVAVLVVRSDALGFSSFLSPDAEAAIDQANKWHTSPPHLGARAALLVLFSDVLHLHPASVLAAFQQSLPGVPIIGAGASGSARKMETYQWSWRDGCDTLNDCISRQGISGFLMWGDFEPFIGVAQSCTPLGEPYVITRAEGHLIWEIANRPAVEILEEATASLPGKQREQAATSLVAGLVVNEEKYPQEVSDFVFRNIAGIEPDSGSLVISESVRVGQTIQFYLRNAHAASLDITRRLRELAAATSGRRIRMGFYFDCLARGVGLYGEPDHDTRLIRRFFPDTPIVGFFGNAEFAPNGDRSILHNYTGVLTLIAEVNDQSRDTLANPPITEHQSR